MRPAIGWLIQQLVKLSFAFADEDVLVNVDSDVRFIRPVDPQLFVRDGLTRMYRLPDGIVAGMHHVKWHRNVARLLGVRADAVPMADFVGNVISWDRRIVREACERIEAVTGLPWHVAFTRGRQVGEYLVYGLFVDKVIGREAARVWVDERSWCHTYWGPEPLTAERAGFREAQRRRHRIFDRRLYGDRAGGFDAATALVTRLAGVIPGRRSLRSA